MLLGRFLPMLAAFAVAGSLAVKRVAPIGAGTLRTTTPTFIVLLVAVVISRPHLPPRPDPGPGRPVPQRSAVLTGVRRGAAADPALGGRREWLPQDHLEWFVIDAVEAMDLRHVGVRIATPEAGGARRAAVDSRALRPRT